MQMEILKSQGRLDQNLRFLYLLLPGLALFLTKGKDLLLFTIVTNELVVELQGGPSMMCGFLGHLLPWQQLEILKSQGRLARPEFEISKVWLACYSLFFSQKERTCYSSPLLLMS